MAGFHTMTTESIHTRLETILERTFDLKGSEIHIHGSSSPLSLGLFLSQTYSKKINDLPHVVITSSFTESLRLQEAIQFFDPTRQVHILRGFDVNPYSGLYPNAKFVAERIGFLAKAQGAKFGEIFICPIDALLQKTLPREFLKLNTKLFSVGDEMPSQVADYLNSLGYESAPLVEDMGQYALRGGIIDIFSPTHRFPVRIDLFGDQIETLRFFDPENQRTVETISSFTVVPCKEVLFQEDRLEKTIEAFKRSTNDRNLNQPEVDEIVRSLVLKNYFPGSEFLLPYFYDNLVSPLEHFPGKVNYWFLDPIEVSRASDDLYNQIKNDYNDSVHQPIRPNIENFYYAHEEIPYLSGSRFIYLSLLEHLDNETSDKVKIEYQTYSTHDFSVLAQNHIFTSPEWTTAANQKLRRWREDGYRIFVACKNQSSIERISFALDKMNFRLKRAKDEDRLWDQWLNELDRDSDLIYIIPHPISESLRIGEERIILLKEEDFLGRKQRATSKNDSVNDFQKKAKRLSFGDLKVGDYVVHVKHGVGQYEGLKLMNISGVESEYIQVAYKDKDKLYLPVYRVSQLQKFSSGNALASLDKLGGTAWEKTKSKVKAHVKDIAAELLALYAKRSELHRPPMVLRENEIISFDNSFPYEETDDQLRAIQDIRKDFLSEKPMDRLVCGDVGFGKTEVAMRAAFYAVQDKRQVAVLAPTTVLTFQHFENFKKRFSAWPIEIRVLNRFVTTAEVKKTLAELKDGKVDIIIGTHKLLGSTIQFKNLGLLIIDEEQKFGVTHKEKIKKLKNSVDTLTLSATPIPRTLNMALVGIRDLSLINTAPVDRLPTRTFVTKWDDETIRKAISAEISRGGQVYFIHNRIESIYGVADELRKIVPEARIKVAHGQLEEHELEKTMMSFFNHEVDVLVCTAIVESGMDVPRANTMFIDTAYLFGLSQLYQLRGRVGRSKTRAYCYLMMPRNKKLDKEQQERLKIIQDNTALGSGIKIAQYDLELRGSGNILGDEQSGHVNSVGYELYMDLLNQALAEAKGEAVEDMELDPELNLKIPALIPDSYIKDIRLRLGYYKALADIHHPDEIDQIEEELRDQFGPLPEQTVNLMGLMLIRKQCKDLGVRDISAGLKSISLIFTEKTKLEPTKIIQLAVRESKKYSLTPDNRLNIKLGEITWGAVHAELQSLLEL